MRTPTSKEIPENEIMPREGNSDNPVPSIDTGVENRSPPSFANQMNINIVFPEDIRPFPKTGPLKLARKGRSEKKSCTLTSTSTKL